MNVKEEADKLSNFSHPSTDSDHFSRLKSTTFRLEMQRFLGVKWINIKVKSATTGEWSSTCIIVVTYYPGRTLMPSPRWKKRKKGQKMKNCKIIWFCRFSLLWLLFIKFQIFSTINAEHIVDKSPKNVSFYNIVKSEATGAKSNNFGNKRGSFRSQCCKMRLFEIIFKHCE